MTDRPLSPFSLEERAFLDASAASSERDAISWTGRLLENASLVGMTWQRRSWEGSQLHGLRFVNCTFELTSFVACGMSNCEFVGCTFADCRFDRAQLTDTAFVECTLNESSFRGSSLLMCHFDRCNVVGAWFEEAQLEVEMRGGELTQTRITDCKIGRLQLADAGISAVRFSESRAERIILQHCDVQQLEVLGGTIAALLIYGGMVARARWAELACDLLELHAIREIESLYVNTCKIERLAVMECPAVADLYIFRCHVRQLVVEDSGVEGWFTHSSLAQGSRFIGCTLTAFHFDESRCDGLSIERTTLTERFGARNAHFTGLRLTDLAVTEAFQWALEGASFEGSDAFPEAVR